MDMNSCVSNILYVILTSIVNRHLDKQLNRRMIDLINSKPENNNYHQAISNWQVVCCMRCQQT